MWSFLSYMARAAREEDTWRVCLMCGCFEPFQDMTDTCCRTQYGVACIFPFQHRRGGTDARERARGPPQGSRSRSRSCPRNLNTLAAAAHLRAERAAEGAATSAREAGDAAARTAETAAEARAAAGAARIHASVAQAARNAAAAPARRLARTSGFGLTE